MKRLPRVTAREVESALLREGFQFSHAKGSHRSYIKESKRVIIPFHGNRIIPPGTLRNILRQAGLSLEDFEKLL
jgi:predicted RNA binding protein YcfA (HicA-like mRNA interferase family)